MNKYLIVVRIDTMVFENREYAKKLARFSKIDDSVKQKTKTSQ